MDGAVALASIVSAAGDALYAVLSWPNVLYPVAGTLLAMCIAALPGVSGTTLLALAIPLTLSWDPLPVALFFGALVGGGTYMGSVTAILLNIPGTAPNAATCLDGYPLARRGEAAAALGCSATASALGSTFGIVTVVLSVPLVVSWIGFVGPPELLVLSLWGLLSVASIFRESIVRGLAMTCLGLALGCVGLDPTTAVPRFTFGTLYLQDGIPLVPVFLGVFAIAETIDLLASGRRTIADALPSKLAPRGLLSGVRTTLRHWRLLLKSSAIGTVVGLVPGVGGTVAAFVAYGEAARSAGPTGRFGDGDIRGVLAPEAANDAKDGGSLLPALALGIPASAGTALLLVALQVHGITPGRALMTEDLEFVFVLVWSLFVSNWLTSLIGLSLAGSMVRLTTISTDRLVPPVLILACVGAFAYRGRFADVALALAFGVVGFLMKHFGWPRVALVIALVLGPIVELNLRLSLRLHRLERIDLWTHPSILLGLVLLIGTLFFFRWSPWKRRSR